MNIILDIFKRPFLFLSLAITVLISGCSFYSYVDNTIVDNRKEVVVQVESSGKINFDAYKMNQRIITLEKQIAEEKDTAKLIKNKIKEIGLDAKIVSQIMTVNKKVTTSDAYELADEIIKQSKETKIPVKYFVAIAKVESYFNKNAVGTSGEVSYFQVMPVIHKDTVDRLRKEKSIYTTNLKNVKTNSAVAATILRSCFDRYSSIDMKLACYNGSQKDVNKTYSKKVLEQVALLKL